MDARSRRAREIQGEIRSVLLSDWDPIGFGTPRDEYDAYIGGVYHLLARGSDPVDLARHLASVEREAFGFATEPERLMDVATRLCGIDVRLDVRDTT